MGTSIWQKIASVLLGIFFFFLLLEAGLRLGGLVLLSIQEYGNVRSIEQKGVYRILCIGESTTQGQYPHLLERVLNQRNIGVRFQVIDKGRTGVNTFFILNRIETYLAEHRPDMVVAMMGINDKSVRYYQDIPESDAWLFRHCRVYRFGRILGMHILKKIKREDIYGSNKVAPDKKNKPRNAGTAAEKVDFGDTEGSPGPVSPSLSRTMLSEARESLMKTDPKNDEAYAELGRLYQEQGEFLEAENSFKKAIELDPKNFNACIRLGTLYRKQDKFLQAEDAFKKALELEPENAYAYVELGWLYRYQDKLSQAADSLKKAIEFNPKYDNAYIELGRLYREQGEFLQAEDLFKKAIEINPENERVLGALSSLYEEMGKPELAKEYAEKTNGFRLEYCVPGTVNNYRKLQEILDRKGIKLVCVQYPVRHVGPLKRIFEKDKGVIFVDNERVFKEALKEAGYKEYFRDTFGGDFGHCTWKGNMLLAQNIADVILREVFEK